MPNMKLAYLLPLLLLLLPAVVYGQFTAEDSLRAIKMDEGMILRIWSRPESESLTYAELIEVLGDSLSMRRRTGPVTASLAYNYHLIPLYIKNYEPALVKPYIDTAIILRMETGAPTADIAQSYYEKGRVMRLIGDYQSSLRFHEEALRIMDRAITESSLTPFLAEKKAYFLKEAAYAAKLNGNYKLGHLRLAQIPALVPIASKSAQTVFEAMITEADIESEEGNYIRSVQLYELVKSLPYYTDVNDTDRAVVLNNQGLANMRAGSYQEAEGFFKSALIQFNQNRRRDFEIAVLANLIHLNNLRGRPEEAINLLAQADRMLESIPTLRYGNIIGELYVYSGEAASLLGRHEQADSLFARAATTVLEDARLSGPALLPRISGNNIYSQLTLLELLAKKRESFRRRNQLPNALATARTIDTLLRYNREQLNLTASLGQFISRETEQYAEAIDIALKLYRESGDEAYLNEAYQFASEQKSNLLRRYLTSPGLAASLGVAEEVVQEKSELELLILTTERAFQNAVPAARDSLLDSLLRLNATADQLKRRISRDYPSFSQALRGFPAIDPADAARSLENDRMVIEFFLSQDSIYLFTLTKAVGLEVTTVARPPNLAELIGSVVDQGEGTTVLFDLLLTPVLSGRSEITRLQFIPDGDLWKLPFAALSDGDGLLINDYAVSFAYAAPLLFNQNLASRARAQTQKYLGYGISYEGLQSSLTNGEFRSSDLDDLRNMGQLPFAVREVTNAAQTIGGTSYINDGATLQRFLTESAGVEILHLSMHGLLRPNPMESSLVFRAESGGYELLSMKDVLGGHYPAELTVLSACHTGGGPLQTNEGMQSIGRAFTAAGSRATITSTWAARDETTHDILTAFIVELGAGEAKDIALQKAINAYLKNGSLADRVPKKWANLTLTGDVQAINEKPGWKWFLIGLVSALAVGGIWLWKQIRARQQVQV